jgi:formate--tetrahydrofolate ligase
MRSFGLPVVVAINHFGSDTQAETDLLQRMCDEELGVTAVLCRHWAKGAAGATDLAHAVAALCEGPAPSVTPLYPDAKPLADKILTIATEIYGAADIALDAKAAARLEEIEAAGYGDLPICMAKTQYSFTTDPSRMGAPSGHTVSVRDVRLSAGAGFVVAICGDIMTMPGLPRVPAAEGIHIDSNGLIQGLF